MKRINSHILLILSLMLVNIPVLAQESIFSGIKSDLKIGDEYYRQEAYPDAISHYRRIVDKNKGDNKVMLKIAKAYYHSNEMYSAVQWYDRYVRQGNQLSGADILTYAGALQMTGETEKAIIWMEKYLDQYGEDLEVSKRIWQLRNMEFLLEDSMYYHVKPTSINTPHDEIAPVFHENSLIFASNRDRVQIIKKILATDNKQFYNWYISKLGHSATDKESEISYLNPVDFGRELTSKYHKGSISFFPGGDSIIFVRTNEIPNENDTYNTQLFFARKINDTWSEYAPFPYNNPEYSFNHPFLSQDGKTLYFTSDMPRGKGGTDLYFTEFLNGKWTLPKNMGEEINTSQDEGHPFVQDHILYFSSTGHPGLGGMDIFKVNMSVKPLEISNLGYPLNTRFDDFGLKLNADRSFGYFVSDRNSKSNRNDDIFEIYLDRLSFPLTVEGGIKYKRHIPNSTSADEMFLLHSARLELIDKSRNLVVSTATTDEEGKFSIEIPYESQFLLKVKQEDLGVAVVSMEIPRNHKDYMNHEIVIIEDLFKTLQD